MKSKKQIEILRPKNTRPYMLVRVDEETKETLLRAAAAHSKKLGRPVTQNKLIAHYVKNGLNSDSVLKKAS